MTPLRLAEPALDLLPHYTAALERGWSPNTTRDVTGEQLDAIRRDPAAFVADLASHAPGTFTMPDGHAVERLPAWIFWIWDAGFCGTINLRFRPGTLDLPPHVSGHAGYAVVPWRRREGIATRALALLLPVAAGLGLPRLLLTCDEDNAPSARVIRANGGTEAGEADGKRLFWVSTTR